MNSQLEFHDLDSRPAYRALLAAPPCGPIRLDAERISRCETPMVEGLCYNWAAKLVDDSILSLLAQLANEQQAVAKFASMAAGAHLNSSEDRMVLHHLTRGLLLDDIPNEAQETYGFYRTQLRRIAEFAARVQSGSVRAPSGRSFEHVVQIGIGGSDLGPRALYMALENWARADIGGPRLRGHFVSNVDPDDMAALLNRIDPTRALFILVSKSGTTQETLANEALLIDRLRGQGVEQPRQHIVVVTARNSPLAQSNAYLDAFYIDDAIGGRYSSTSAVGGVVLSLAFGSETFAELLRGAHAADRSALNEDIRANSALLDALIGVYERNLLACPFSAVLPYSQALARFPAHLQQLDMESNGKRTTRNRNEASYPTGPIIFGEPGTNGQHSFYQLLHQGSDIVPLQFIGFRRPQLGRDAETDGTTNQAKLNANLAAQIVAFAHGRPSDDLFVSFDGRRPASVIYGERLTPAVLGALLAHFENKIAFQGFLWNLNSFDQPGVQLGKQLANKLLSGSPDEALIAYAERFGIRLQPRRGSGTTPKTTP